MKLIWSRRDTAALKQAMRTHPATIGRQLDQERLADVIDINSATRRRKDSPTTHGETVEPCRSGAVEVNE